MISVILAVLVIGFLLMALEVFVIPGFGIAGVLGVLCLIAGTSIAWLELGAGWGILSGMLASLIAVAMLLILPRTRAGKRLILDSAQDQASSHPDQSNLLGRIGVTTTPLRPTGQARFDQINQKEVDVVTDGEYIGPSVTVKVIHTEGVRVLVTKHIQLSS